MKITSPIAATVIFGAAAALLVATALSLPLSFMTRLTTLNGAMMLCLATYGVLLARMSARPIRAIAAPVLMLAAVLPVAASLSGFLAPAAAGLAWIRSGICFSGPAGRRIIVEALLSAGGLALCAALRPAGILGWALGLWMFFLLQALYFVVIPALPFRRREPLGPESRQALRSRAQELLREQKLERAFEDLQL
jgi:hypothetical protein